MIERMNREIELLRKLYALTTDAQLRNRIAGRGKYLVKRVADATPKLDASVEALFTSKFSDEPGHQGEIEMSIGTNIETANEALTQAREYGLEAEVFGTTMTFMAQGMEPAQAVACALAEWDL